MNGSEPTRDSGQCRRWILQTVRSLSSTAEGSLAKSADRFSKARTLTVVARADRARVLSALLSNLLRGDHPMHYRQACHHDLS